jgi:hypothetical protein
MTPLLAAIIAAGAALHLPLLFFGALLVHVVYNYRRS